MLSCLASNMEIKERMLPIPSGTVITMTAISLFFVVNCVPVAHSKPPDGYYEGTEGKLGASLKEVLHLIIDDHRPIKKYTHPSNEDLYDGKKMDVWEALVYTDSACPDSDPKCGKVELLYLGEIREIALRYRKQKEVSCKPLWEREHVWPTSRGFPEDRQVGYRDLHHIRPADKTINGKHSNYGYNIGGNDVYDQEKNCQGKVAVAKLNRHVGSFEPPDRAKGQVARMLFYMAVRYEGEHKESVDLMPDLQLKAKNEHVKKRWIGNLCVLLDWNRSYPPTVFEKRRNDRVMELQDNRNPFIDKPSWADDIWLHSEEGNKCEGTG